MRSSNTLEITLEDLPIDIFRVILTFLNFHEKLKLVKLSKKIEKFSKASLEREEKIALNYIEEINFSLLFIIGKSKHEDFFKESDVQIIKKILKIKEIRSIIKEKLKITSLQKELLSLYLSLSPSPNITLRNLNACFSPEFINFYFFGQKKIFMRQAFEFSLFFFKHFCLECHEKNPLTTETQPTEIQHHLATQNNPPRYELERKMSGHEDLFKFLKGFTFLLENLALNPQISEKILKKKLIGEEEFLNFTLLFALSIQQTHFSPSRKDAIEKLKTIGIENKAFYFEKFNELLEASEKKVATIDSSGTVRDNILKFVFSSSGLRLLETIGGKNFLDMINLPLFIPSFLEITETSGLQPNDVIQKIKAIFDKKNVCHYFFGPQKNIIFREHFFCPDQNKFIPLSQKINLLKFIITHGFPQSFNFYIDNVDSKGLARMISTKNESFSEKSLFQIFLLSELLLLFKDPKLYLNEKRTGVSDKIKTFIGYIEELNPTGKENKTALSGNEMSRFIFEHAIRKALERPPISSSFSIQDGFSEEMQKLNSWIRANIRALIKYPDQGAVQTLLTNNSISLKDMLIPFMSLLFNAFGFKALENRSVNIEKIKSRYFENLKYYKTEFNEISCIEKLDILFDFKTLDFSYSEVQKKSLLSLISPKKIGKEEGYYVSSIPLTEAIQLSVLIDAIDLYGDDNQIYIANRNSSPKITERYEKIISLINAVNTAIGEKKPLIDFMRFSSIIQVCLTKTYYSRYKGISYANNHTLLLKTLTSLKKIIRRILPESDSLEIFNLFLAAPGTVNLIRYIQNSSEKDYRNQIDKIKEYYSKNIFSRWNSTMSMRLYIFFDFFNCFNFFDSHDDSKLNSFSLDSSEIVFFNSLLDDIDLEKNNPKTELEKRGSEWIKAIFEKKLINKRQFLELYVKLKIIMFFEETLIQGGSFSGKLISFYLDSFNSNSAPRSEFIDFDNTVMTLIGQTSNLFERSGKNTPLEIRNLLCLWARVFSTNKRYKSEDFLKNVLFLLNDCGSVLLENELISPLDVLYIPNLKIIFDGLARTIKANDLSSRKKIRRSLLDKYKVLIDKIRGLYNTAFLTKENYINPSPYFFRDMFYGNLGSQGELDTLTMILESSFDYFFTHHFGKKNRILFLKKTGLTLEDFKKIDSYEIKYQGDDGYDTLGFIDKVVSCKFIDNLLDTLSKPRPVKLFNEGKISVDDIYRKFSYILLDFNRGIAALSEGCITIEDFRKLSDSSLEDNVLAQRFDLITRKKGRELLRRKIILFDDLFDIPFLDILLENKNIHLALLNEKIKMSDIRKLAQNVNQNEIMNITSNLKKLGQKRYQAFIGKISIDRIKLEKAAFQKLISKSRASKRKRNDSSSFLSPTSLKEEKRQRLNSSPTSGLFQERNRNKRTRFSRTDNNRSLPKEKASKKHKSSSP